MSVPCVLVTPKRKLAGRLAVMKNILHFFGEFFTEGTGGSALFKVFDSSGNFDQNKFQQLGEVEKQKLIKLPITSDLESVSGSIMNCIGAVQGNGFQKQYKHIKRHRRWSMYKVLQLKNTLFYFSSSSNLYNLIYICIYVTGADKGCPLDSLFAPIHCH